MVTEKYYVFYVIFWQTIYVCAYSKQCDYMFLFVHISLGVIERMLPAVLSLYSLNNFTYLS